MKKHNFKEGYPGEYGFNWGGVSVVRACSGDFGGDILIKTYRKELEIRISPTGLVRCFMEGKELEPKKDGREETANSE